MIFISSLSVHKWYTKRPIIVDYDSTKSTSNLLPHQRFGTKNTHKDTEFYNLREAVVFPDVRFSGVSRAFSRNLCAGRQMSRFLYHTQIPLNIFSMMLFFSLHHVALNRVKRVEKRTCLQRQCFFSRFVCNTLQIYLLR